MSIWQSEQGAQAASVKVAQHVAKADPHPQYERRVKNNLTATAAPAVTDDANAGYEPRSIWFNTAQQEVYRCIGADIGAAVWAKTTLTIDELGSAALSDVGDFDPAGTGASEAANAVAAHEAKTDPHDQYYNASRLTVWSRDKEREALEAATGGACTIERTTNGQACHMFVLPKTTWEDLMPGQELGTGTHEAFIENGVEKSELLVGMYMAAELNGEMVSQPRTVGRRSIDWDQSVAAAQASGFQLFGNWEWSAVALWCMANGFQPRGNTDYGQSHSHPHERGVYDGDGSGEEYTLLGTGPNSWSHNNAANGIADLVGNRWEWVRGFKMVDGRILLAPDNDPTLAESAWVDTGWDMPGNQTWASVDNTGAPESVKRALIVPNGIADPEGYLYTNLSGERFPIRGGTRGNAAYAGLGALALIHARTNANTPLGLRLSRLI
ncbi:Sulfatase-modifying factor enzyme domain-containing protein [Halomonas sp. NYA30]